MTTIVVRVQSTFLLCTDRWQCPYNLFERCVVILNAVCTTTVRVGRAPSTACRSARVTRSTGRFSRSRGALLLILTLSRKSTAGWVQHASPPLQFPACSTCGATRGGCRICLQPDPTPRILTLVCVHELLPHCQHSRTCTSAVMGAAVVATGKHNQSGYFYQPSGAWVCVEDWFSGSLC